GRPAGHRQRAVVGPGRARIHVDRRTEQRHRADCRIQSTARGAPAAADDDRADARRRRDLSQDVRLKADPTTIIMTIEAWLTAALDDAERRGLPALKPILEALARSTAALRAADFNDDAAGRT